MPKPMTEKQIWARRRNWLIRRLMGAKSIFSYDNIVFMADTTQKNAYHIYKCEKAIDRLVNSMRKSEYPIKET